MAGTRNLATAARLGGVVALMLGASFAAVPLYDLFCRVTGYGGTTTVAAAAPETALERTVTVRFDANVSPDLPWTFRPLERTMTVRIGEPALAFYEATNLTDAPLAGTASYNVAPHSAGAFFAKVQCFCFELQVLEPGERVEMPVSFFVDPAIVEDREAGGVTVITLSYTMHPSALPDTRAEVAPGPVRLAAADAPSATPRAVGAPAN